MKIGDVVKSGNNFTGIVCGKKRYVNAYCLEVIARDNKTYRVWEDEMFLVTNKKEIHKIKLLFSGNS